MQALWNKHVLESLFYYLIHEHMYAITTNRISVLAQAAWSKTEGILFPILLITIGAVGLGLTVAG